jgi:hypothetical protein
MYSRVQLKNMAINLRKLGYSYNEIINELEVPKSTLSYWLKDINLTEQQNIDLNNRLKDRVARGRLRTGIALKARRIFRENKTIKEAENDFQKYISEPFFSAGILLYWAEGTKKDTTFSFTNSDPRMVVLMVKWIKKYLILDSSLLKYRLFIHYPYRSENCEEYWAKLLDVDVNTFQKTIYKPTPHDIKKNNEYKGCIRVSITRVDPLRRVMAWQKLLIKYYDTI